jgi:hypothetical protein
MKAQFKQLSRAALAIIGAFGLIAALVLGAVWLIAGCWG